MNRAEKMGFWQIRTDEEDEHNLSILTAKSKLDKSKYIKALVRKEAHSLPEMARERIKELLPELVTCIDSVIRQSIEVQHQTQLDAILAQTKAKVSELDSLTLKIITYCRQLNNPEELRSALLKFKELIPFGEKEAMEAVNTLLKKLEKEKQLELKDGS